MMRPRRKRIRFSHPSLATCSTPDASAAWRLRSVPVSSSSSNVPWKRFAIRSSRCLIRTCVHQPRAARRWTRERETALPHRHHSLWDLIFQGNAVPRHSSTSRGTSEECQKLGTVGPESYGLARNPYRVKTGNEPYGSPWNAMNSMRLRSRHAAFCSEPVAPQVTRV